MGRLMIQSGSSAEPDELPGGADAAAGTDDGATPPSLRLHRSGTRCSFQNGRSDTVMKVAAAADAIVGRLYTNN